MSRSPRPRAAVTLALALASAVSLAAPAARAAPPGAEDAREASAAAVAEGRAHFARGVELFREGDYRSALIEFRRAYEIAPNYRILYNLGKTELELLDYAGALQSFERYLADGGNAVPADRRTSVTADIKKLKSRVAELSITTTVPGANVFIDDVLVGTTPLATPVRVSAGRRRVYATRESRVSPPRLIDVAGGDAANIEIVFAEAPRAPPDLLATSPRVTAPAPPPEHRAGTTVWIGGAVTALGAIGTLAEGITTLAVKKTFVQTLDTFPVSADQIEVARKRVKDGALYTDIFGAITIGAGSATIIAYLVGRLGTPASAPKSAASSVSFGVAPRAITATFVF
jgi:Tetratricopeptide repeat/PEGA domain